jgi:propanediol dehydratase small subunit
MGIADLRIHPETLERQAVIAEEHGNPQLAANLRRAAELTALADDEVLAVYEALRPGRSSAAELTALAESLAARGLPLNAALVAEAAEVYAHRGLARLSPMSVVAGIDVGNATTEVVLVADGVILAAGRALTRGRKGSPESLRGAAALVRRLERQAGRRAGQARVAPLRPADTSVRALSEVRPVTGRLRVLAAGVATPGGAGACVGAPVTPSGQRSVTAASVIAVVPPGMRYDEAAVWIRGLTESGARVGAVLVAGDEGVLVANRLAPSGRKAGFRSSTRRTRPPPPPARCCTGTHLAGRNRPPTSAPGRWT